MSSPVFPHCFRALIVVCLAIGIICSEFSRPLASGGEAATVAATPAPTAPPCCCDLRGTCGMPCCAMRAPAVPDVPVPAPRPDERPPSFYLVISPAGLTAAERISAPCDHGALRASRLVTGPSLQSLQVRLEV